MNSTFGISIAIGLLILFGSLLASYIERDDR
jgi:hypothetical protein